MKKSKSEYSIQTVVNALRVLEAFEHVDELGVTDLSRHLDLHKNNVFRLLATLEMKGYIEQVDDGPYRLGTRCLELGSAYRRAGGNLLGRAAPVLDALAHETSETVHLGVLREFEVVHLDAREASQTVRVGARLGHRLPAHCTALGKVLVGCAGEKLLRDYDRWLAEQRGLERRTDATIVDRDKLFEHLQGVGVRRVAVDLGECEEGLCCAAAPVFEPPGRLVAALSVSAPTLRHDSDSVHGRLGPAVIAAAQQLSSQLGHSG